MTFLIALLSFIAGGFVTYLYLLDSIREINPTVGASIIAASTTITVSVLTVVIGNHLDRRKSEKEKLREKKIPIYERLMAIFFKTIFSAGEAKKTKSTKKVDTVQELREIIPELMSWGSDEVIEDLSLFRQKLFMQEDEDLTIDDYVLVAFANLMMSLRKDLGHQNYDLNNGKLLQIIINDRRLREPGGLEEVIMEIEQNKLQKNE